MFEVKKDTATWVPVRLLDSAGTPVTGVAFGSVTATAWKADSTTAVLTVTVSDWAEISADDFSGLGVYSLKLPVAETDVQGPFMYAVAAAGAETFVGSIKVVTNEEVDTKTVVDGIRTDYTTGRASNLDNLDAASSTLATAAALVTAQSDLTDLMDIGLGRWKIEVTGGDANRLVLYRQDGVTVLKKFDLLDSAGDPTFINPFTREPV